MINVLKYFHQDKARVAAETNADLNKTMASASSTDSINFLYEDYDTPEPAIISSEILNLSMERDKVNFFEAISKFSHLDAKIKADVPNIARLAPKVSATFWIENGNKFPFLRKLALILLNVPASSAFIERYYSICGNVCKKRCGNFSPDTIIYRSMLKANIHLLDGLIFD